jgi:hypothetical protein
VYGWFLSAHPLVILLLEAINGINKVIKVLT